MDTKQATSDYRLAQWTSRIREYFASGLTVKSWCAEKGINESIYYYWLRRVRAAACEALVPKEDHVQIVPVNLSNDANVLVPPRTEMPVSAITIRFGTVTVEVQNSASVSLIENTLRALQSVSGGRPC